LGDTITAGIHKYIMKLQQLIASYQSPQAIRITSFAIKVSPVLWQVL